MMKKIILFIICFLIGSNQANSESKESGHTHADCFIRDSFLSAPDVSETGFKLNVSYTRHSDDASGVSIYEQRYSVVTLSGEKIVDQEFIKVEQKDLRIGVKGAINILFENGLSVSNLPYNIGVQHWGNPNSGTRHDVFAITRQIGQSKLLTYDCDLSYFIRD